MVLWSKKNAKLEKLFEQNKSTQNALALATGYYAAHMATRERGDLLKAYHAAVTAYTQSPQSLPLIFCNGLLNIEMEHWDSAEDLLDKASYYKNYFKKEDPPYYCSFLYLSAFFHMKRSKSRAALKFSKLLQEYIEELEEPSSFGLLLLGLIKLELALDMKLKPDQEAEALDGAAGYLRESYTAGCRSRFLYIALYRCFKRKEPRDTRLLIPLIQWGLVQGLELQVVMEARREELSRQLSERLEMSRAIYSIYPEPWVLRELVKGLIGCGEESQWAFQYYKEAESKQINAPLLAQFLIRAAFRNKVEDVSRYSLEQFLRLFLSPDGTDDEMKAFVYHLLLTKKQFKELSVGYEQDILRFAFHALDSRMSGRACNSIYRFLLSALQGPLSIGNQKLQEYMQAAEAVVLENLFCYHCCLETSREEAKILYIMEEEKKEPVRYDMEEGEAVIKASGDHFSCIILGTRGSQVIKAAPQVTKCMENADVGLYLYFYRKGIVSDTLLIALAKHYMSPDSVLNGDRSLENPEGKDLEQEAVDVLSRLLTLKTLSQGFHMQAAAFLGGLLASDQNQYSLALKYYRSVNENYLHDQYIEQMFQVFMNTKEYDRAVRLILKKSHCISDRTLFFALKKLAGEEKYQISIADAAYELILKSWYDKRLLDLVIKNYNGSQEEWQVLSHALSGISVFEPALDEIILKNSIWLHKLDEGSQRVFARVYRNMPDSPLIDDYVYYCVYEMLINLVKPLYETMEILEKIYLERKDSYLAYALSVVYLEHGLSTFESEKILREAAGRMEEGGLLFPQFKNMKDKTLSTPYIEKNQSFMYRTLPDKKVLLYYKFEGDTSYSAKSMKYLRYGLYQTNLIFFYGDKLSYYYSEELPTGSITTQEAFMTNNQMTDMENGTELYYVINDALIFEKMFRYDRVEEIITDLLKETRRIKGEIM